MLQESTDDVEYKDEQERKHFLSANSTQLHRGFIPSKNRALTKLCSRSPIIEFDVTSAPMSPITALHSTGMMFPGIRSRKSSPNTISLNSSPITSPGKPSNKKEEPIDHFPIIHFHEDALLSPDSSSAYGLQSPQVLAVRRRKSSTSTTLSTLSSSRGHLLKTPHRQGKRGLSHNSPLKVKYSPSGGHGPPRVYGSSHRAATASSCDGAESVGSSHSSSTFASGWSRQSIFHPDIEWDSRYQKSPFCIPINCHISCDSNGPNSLSNPADTTMVLSPQEETKTILCRSRLYCT
jgi:hypothetical protein